jgi:hypothetical protein
VAEGAIDRNADRRRRGVSPALCGPVTLTRSSNSPAWATGTGRAPIGPIGVLEKPLSKERLRVQLTLVGGHV